ncbi:hypothetical protein CKY28_02950 [Sphingomonas lenta]|uniref:Uncharacterized protein n=1 Tax=Sphingomonas lenta TaxID=1141887 RepID=A0A2A2SKE5_9SPHN|nr:hypothetical protein CKY28_02950 [Sphingomonas lenta]
MLAAILFELAIGANFIILFGEYVARRQGKYVRRYLGGALVYVFVLSVSAIAAGLDWRILMAMMGAWLAFAGLSGYVTRVDEKELDV